MRRFFGNNLTRGIDRIICVSMSGDFFKCRCPMKVASFVASRLGGWTCGYGQLQIFPHYGARPRFAIRSLSVYFSERLGTAVRRVLALDAPALSPEPWDNFPQYCPFSYS